MKSSFHRRLAAALGADPRDQQKIAAIAGVSPGQLSRWKKDVEPSPSAVAKLVLILNIDGHWLLTGEGTMRRSTSEDPKRLEVIRMVASREIEVDTLDDLLRVDHVTARGDLLEAHKIISKGHPPNGSTQDKVVGDS